MSKYTNIYMYIYKTLAIQVNTANYSIFTNCTKIQQNVLHYSQKNSIPM